VTGWPTEDAFYRGDSRRAPSRETDYGERWTFDVTGARWRVSHLHATGEIIASTTDRVHPNPINGRADRVVLLGWLPDPVAVDRALRGWQRHVEEPKSLQWATMQIRRAGVGAEAVTEAHRRQAHAESIGARGAPAQGGLF